MNIRVRPDQSSRAPNDYPKDRQVHVPAERNDSIQESYEIERNTFTATDSAAVHESCHQNPNSASAPCTIDFDIPSVDEEYVFLNPDAAVSQADTVIPSTVGDLVLDSSREYEDHFKPHNMNQIQLEDHLEDISREVQQRVPLPDLDPNANDPSVRMTFENGYASHDKVYFNDDLKYSFMSYDYLWRIRTASGRLPVSSYQISSLC